MRDVMVMFCLPYEMMKEQREALLKEARKEVSPFIRQNLTPGCPHPDNIDVCAVNSHRNAGDECIKCQVQNLPLTRESGEKLFMLIAVITRRSLNDPARHVRIYDPENVFSPVEYAPEQRIAA